MRNLPTSIRLPLKDIQRRSISRRPFAEMCNAPPKVAIASSIYHFDLFAFGTLFDPFFVRRHDGIACNRRRAKWGVNFGFE